MDVNSIAIQLLSDGSIRASKDNDLLQFQADLRSFYTSWIWMIESRLTSAWLLKTRNQTEHCHEFSELLRTVYNNDECLVANWPFARLFGFVEMTGYYSRA